MKQIKITNYESTTIYNVVKRVDNIYYLDDNSKVILEIKDDIKFIRTTFDTTYEFTFSLEHVTNLMVFDLLYTNSFAIITKSIKFQQDYLGIKYYLNEEIKEDVFLLEFLY